MGICRIGNFVIVGYCPVVFRYRGCRSVVVFGFVLGVGVWGIVLDGLILRSVRMQ